MANNSFLLRGWAISLIAVVLALSKGTSATTGHFYFTVILLLLVTILFWYLDAFFLHKEKCYRKLYEWVLENRNQTQDYLYSLDYTRFKQDVKSVFCVMFSKALFPFYGLVILILIVVAIFDMGRGVDMTNMCNSLC